MDLTIQEKLKKVYALVDGGATEGEKQAAKIALDKLLKKYDLEGINLENLSKKDYSFTYTTSLEQSLLVRICLVLIDHDFNDEENRFYKQKIGSKTLWISLEYNNWVTVDCAYEYFRRHMKVQWDKYSKQEIAKKRTAKTKKARRDELMKLFFHKYAISSGLFKPEEIERKTIDLSKLSEKQAADRARLQSVQGGEYNRQVTNGLMIE